MRGFACFTTAIGLGAMLSMSAGKASAQSAEYVTFDFALQVIGPGLAVGSFELVDSGGGVIDSGYAEETFEFIHQSDGIIVAKGEKTLFGEKGTITISFVGIIMPDETTGLLVATSPWHVSDGTGEYETLHGAGLGEATLNPVTGELNASYPGMVDSLPDDD